MLSRICFPRLHLIGYGRIKRKAVYDQTMRMKIDGFQELFDSLLDFLKSQIVLLEIENQPISDDFIFYVDCVGQLAGIVLKGDVQDVLPPQHFVRGDVNQTGGFSHSFPRGEDAEISLSQSTVNAFFQNTNWAFPGEFFS
jgi:hypothetical protein